MNHKSVTLTGREIMDRWQSDNLSAEQVAGERIIPDSVYVINWPEHVLIPRLNGDCDIRRIG